MTSLSHDRPRTGRRGDGRWSVSPPPVARLPAPLESNGDGLERLSSGNQDLMSILRLMTDRVADPATSPLCSVGSPSPFCEGRQDRSPRHSG